MGIEAREARAGWLHSILVRNLGAPLPSVGDESLEVGREGCEEEKKAMWSARLHLTFRHSRPCTPGVGVA